jgi:hypothetical protein
MVEHLRHPSSVFEDDRPGRRRLGQPVADRDDRDLASHCFPVRIERLQRRHQQTVGALVKELLEQCPFPVSVAVRIGNDGVPISAHQSPGKIGTETLLPQVTGGSAQDGDRAGAPAGEGTRDRVDVVSELGRGGSDPPYSVIGPPFSPQCIGDGRRRDPGGVCDVLERGALRHVCRIREAYCTR